MASSVAVDRESSVTANSGGTRPRASSNYSLFNHQPDPVPANIPQLRPRAKSSSNLGVHLEPKCEFEDHTLIDEDGNYQRQSSLAELIDFLKNHPPPADNFMSLPDTRKNEGKGKWSKIRSMAKRSKSVSRSPDPIRLPDSAVSGVTTGGHRHISISIPLDASPFGRTPRTQYPVYSTKGAKGPASRYGPTRAVLNEKGVVTVLRTVTEVHEAEPPLAKRPPPLQHRASAPAGTRLRSQSHSSVGKSQSHSRANSSHSNGRGKVSEFFGVSSSPPRTQQADNAKRTSDKSREPQSSTMAAHETREDNSLPIRGSSLPASRFVFPPTTSIDAMMSEATTKPIYSPTQLQTQRSVNNLSKEADQESKGTNKSTRVGPVQAASKRIITSTTLEEAPVIISSQKTTEGTELTVITKSPTTREDGHISPTPSIASSHSQTRRQKVRDKKRRDMEALRSARRQSQQSEPDSIYGGLSKEEETDPAEDVATSPGRKAKPPPLPLKSPSRQSLSTIMVVSSVQPSPPHSGAAKSPTRDTETAQSPTQSPVEDAKPAQPAVQKVQDQVAQLGMTQVVMAPPEVEPPLASPPLHHGFPKPPKVKPQFRPRPLPRALSTSAITQSSASRSLTNSPVVSFNPNNPTPPASARGSPIPQAAGDRTSNQSTVSVDRSSKQSTISMDRSSKQSSIDGVDRTSKRSSMELPSSKPGPMEPSSLSKRREWNAIREQDRSTRNSRVGSRSLPKPLVLPKEEADDAKSTPLSERDVIRRYDVYREYRFREMERRVRRLERNGDIWLRALIPVLENLNRTLSGGSVGHDESRERAQGWVSDEDFVGSLSPPRGRASFSFGSRRSRMMPPPGASEREFLEHLVRTKEELEAGNISDDMSGFDTIEPLMRELAGRSRLSFEGRAMALAEDDEAMFRGF